MAIVYEFTANTIGFHHSIDKIPSKDRFKMHAHDEYELLYFVSGNGKFTIEGNTYELKKDSIFLMKPAEIHKISVLSDTPYERMVVHFKKEALLNIDPSSILTKVFDERQMGEDNVYFLNEFEGLDVRNLFYAMKTDGETQKKHLAIISNLMPVLYKLESMAKDRKIGHISNKRNDVLGELVNFINRHLSDNLSLEILSKHFFLSKSQLNRIFKEGTGTSIWEYILLKRLMGARNLIKSGVGVVKASQQFGFSDYSAFYRAYKKHYNVSPKSDFKMQ